MRTLRRAAFFSLSSLVLLLGIIACREHVVDIYHIPSGSMRPTLVEDDYVIVSKNVAPEKLTRTSIIIFQQNGERCIKRLIGLPGDTIYFYGGRLYGVDHAGKELSFKHLQYDYIPFVSFEGALETEQEADGKVTAVRFKQMGQPLGRLAFDSGGGMKASLLNGKAYDEFIGIRNYAIARMLTDQETGFGRAVYYLELQHSPSLSAPSPRFIPGPNGSMRLELGTLSSILPLRTEQVELLGGINAFNAEPRYAYYRDGELIVAGIPLLRGTGPSQYPFIDRGPPDKYLIQSHGFTVPEGHYLVLGDNPALSCDSREYGVIPAQAIQGVAISVH